MRKTIIAILVIAILASHSFAGWFSKKAEAEVTELKPAVGYIDKVTEVTNAWDKCIKNYERGNVSKDVRGLAYILVGDITGAGCSVTNSCITASVTANALYHHGEYYYVDIPECDKEHLDDYPKTTTKVEGVQYKRFRTIYIDGEKQTVITSYTYPHRKITTETTTRLEKKKSVKKTLEEIVTPEGK